MFTSLIIPVDLADRADRALPAAAELARRSGLPIELVSVTAPGAENSARPLLEHLAAELKPLATETKVLRGDPVGALVSFLGQRPTSLLVMATHARSALGELLLGSVSEAVLAQSKIPALLIGPEVPTDVAPDMRTVVACVDGSHVSDSLPSVLAEWKETFDGATPWIVEALGEKATRAVLAGGGDLRETADVARAARHLEATGFAAEWDVVHGDDTVDALIDFASRVDGPVLALASARWTDPTRIRLHSTARDLTRHSPHPVLVITPDA